MMQQLMMFSVKKPSFGFLSRRSFEAVCIKNVKMSSVRLKYKDIKAPDASDPDFDPALKKKQSSRNIFDSLDQFVHRHIGPSEADHLKMLGTVGVDSLDQLINKTVPSHIRLKKPLQMAGPRGETEVLAELKSIMDQNEIFRSHLGTGYYGTLTPPVILRNILENPGWYTPYTPYQAEISQGRLQMLLNYQTMVSDLCGLPMANASLLDEATAAAEAMNMCLNSVRGKKKIAFLVSSDIHPQTLAVVRTRAEPLGVEIRVTSHTEFDFSNEDVFGILLQYPTSKGYIHQYEAITKKAHDSGAKVAVASDLLALCLLTPPGEWGADIVLGNSQRFGVPLGYGGPHAAFFATQKKMMRKMPGRIIGVSQDSRGMPALRMMLQTREQHIRRDKATSNICTAQALLANVASAYAIYHGPEGLKLIATKVLACATTFAAGLSDIGLSVGSPDFFDTVHVDLNGANNASDYLEAAARRRINVRMLDDNNMCISFDETNTAEHVNELIQIFAEVVGAKTSFDAQKWVQNNDVSVSKKFMRSSDFMSHPLFRMYHSETDMLRYLRSLEVKDLSLATAMIPLGSCTMKLNGTSEMIPVTWAKVGNLHPFAPLDQVRGYTEMMEGAQRDLEEITGFDGISLQPNSGAQGEYAGLLTIREYFRKNNQANRTICLIPQSAHGTNPASAAMAAMKVVVVKCDSEGNIDFEDLKSKAEKHSNNLAALMITYPSTHGVFEENIHEVCSLIHEHGGQVYMDGANMNAQTGLCCPAEMGADVCHLNLHKTFCIPHGGGGPGLGPIGVKKHLIPFLPGHPMLNETSTTGPIAASPYSSASILVISWMYIKLMGGSGLTDATKMAILNANYMACRLSEHYKILYTGINGTCAHEFIIDLSEFKSSVGIVEEDVAKRLQDYNFHAPTMSWPVVGTLMVEPTESEPLSELDRFCDAMISIREEIQEIANGAADKTDNVLKGAPHTADTVISDNWNRAYSREKAAYPMQYLRESKFWPTVGRLDNVYGDRNIMCSCPPLSAYE